MPNYCTYNMKVKGDAPNIQKLVNWLNADWDDDYNCFYYKGKKQVPTEHHIGYRVFTAEVIDQLLNKETIVEITGNCAWSVMTCMFDEGTGCYMSTREDKSDLSVISIVDASKELDLEIEIFSSEPGVAFSEHYYINKGELIVNEETKYVESYDVETDSFIGPFCKYLTKDGNDWKWKHIK